MLTVLSQPFFRQRHAVIGVTPTRSNHFERLITELVIGDEFEVVAFINENGCHGYYCESDFFVHPDFESRASFLAFLIRQCR